MYDQKMYPYYCVLGLMLLTPYNLVGITMRSLCQGALRLIDGNLAELYKREKLFKNRAEIEEGLVASYAEHVEEMDKKRAQEADAMIRRYYIRQRDQWRSFRAEHKKRLKEITEKLTALQTQIDGQEKERMRCIREVYPLF